MIDIKRRGSGDKKKLIDEQKRQGAELANFTSVQSILHIHASQLVGRRHDKLLICCICPSRTVPPRCLVLVHLQESESRKNTNMFKSPVQFIWLIFNFKFVHHVNHLVISHLIKFRLRLLNNAN